MNELIYYGSIEDLKKMLKTIQEIDDPILRFTYIRCEYLYHESLYKLAQKIFVPRCPKTKRYRDIKDWMVAVYGGASCSLSM